MRGSAVGLLCLALVVVARGAIARPGAGDVLADIRAARLDPERSIELDDVQLDLGLGTLTLTSGHLLPALPIAGVPREFAFVGEGRLRIEAPDAIERHQLSLFTGSSSFDAKFDRAVLVLGNTDIADHLLARPNGEPVSPERRQEAQDLMAGWLGGAERRGFGAEAAVWKLASGDQGQKGFFAALVESSALGRFYYVIDPTELEQVTLGQFKPVELDEIEEYRTERWIRREQKKGRALQLQLEDLGDWDTWLSASLRDAQGRPQPGSTGFEPRRYRIDATVDPDALKISARATIELQVSASGRRGVSFTLFRDLDPTAVRDDRDRPLEWYRSGSELHVLLAEPTVAKQPLAVTVDYGGVLFEKYEKGVFVVRDTFAWFPRTGTIDRATYEVTLRCPKGLQALASGRLVESSIEGPLRVDRRELDLPALGFSFEIGDYELHREQVGHVELTVGFSKTTLGSVAGAKDEVLETLRGALTTFESDFGPYPLDYLTVATVPRDFSQGFISFVTLTHYLLGMRSNALIVDNSVRLEDQGRALRRETVAHELAHQWWGNKVGWYSYRDQWLSEALASYAAVRYVAGEAVRPSVQLARNAEGWRRALRTRARDGRSVESLGPVVLGQRLSSSKSSSAYNAIVYDKGALVFSMLARELGDDELTQMLSALATAVNHRALDTDAFVKSLEHMSGRDLGAFAERYIYGVGVPELHYDYRFERGEDGGWLIRGSARSVARSLYRCKLVRTEQETWDVVRKRGEAADADFKLVVPFQVALEGSDPDGATRAAQRTGFATARGLGGDLVLEGEVTHFSIPVKEQPAAFWFDQRGEVLALFYNETRAPKRVLLYRAMDLEGAEAKAILEQALAAPLVTEQAREEQGWSEKEARQRAELEDARIHLELSRVHLDQGELAAAEASLKAAEKGLGGVEAATNRIRLAVRSGDYKTAWNRMEGKLYLDLDRGDSTADALRRLKWMEGVVGDGEEYALLAVAAHATGHQEIALRAAEEAEERGADLTELRVLLPRRLP